MRFNFSSSQPLDDLTKNGKDHAGSRAERSGSQANDRFSLFFSSRTTVKERGSVIDDNIQRSTAGQRPRALENKRKYTPMREPVRPVNSENTLERKHEIKRSKETNTAKDSSQSVDRTTESDRPEQSQHVERTQSNQAQDGQEQNAQQDGHRVEQVDASTVDKPHQQGASDAQQLGSGSGAQEDLIKAVSGSVEAENIAALTALVAGMMNHQPVLDPAVAMAAEAALKLSLDGENGKPAKTIVAQWMSMTLGTAKATAEGGETSLDADTAAHSGSDQLLSSGGEGKDGKANQDLLKGTLRAGGGVVAAQDKAPIVLQDARNATNNNNFMAAFSNAVGAAKAALGEEAGNQSLSPQLLHAVGSGAPVAAQARANNTAAVPQLPVYTPAGQRAWAEDVAVRLNWMVNREQGKAELVLTPPSLGRLGVSLQMNGDQISAHFVTATPAARELLEQALPRLREILQQSNIHLGQSDVSTEQQSFFQQQTGSDTSDERRSSAMRVLSGVGAEDTSDEVSSAIVSARRLDGVVDIFA